MARALQIKNNHIHPGFYRDYCALQDYENKKIFTLKNEMPEKITRQ